ncbi:beta-phosphoglucomutase family hydrolase (plasmid) [Pseudarthrobacter chlorophenolicus A6]|uniref:Beta-phosphoglucomutase family hydrolase n=1 Tax=Pseudarthrobacter chlorophenolicus (strain ATCC 700700 / DSM 12829 / CIP 107037 / JCM 12360 / KCTC 9906 / NCIMB 13794 / A6) TaxID=452863 RepID=B8HIH4_PSECP|nr:HAD-IA family hydrolase [Pseudarthrobacter chlorophenolicus]ACL42221.1 beta-phosphoglucomutase family hydrolase [Pseudarthrobacter chlorophenolicus A6]SDQ15081.1 haloacid dehalogenase superfamily, subfamily IA, variant 3 with third motif having DD or ED [Pseudarthrobacter chlorophenolicus]
MTADSTRQARVASSPSNGGDTGQSWTGASAILFDLDGVLTPTAIVHEQSWKQLFDGYLQDLPAASRYRESDYFDHIDGKPRFDGVRDFLASRNIVLPEGPADDDPASNTVQGLGNRKNHVFNDIIRAGGVQPYEGSVRFIEAARGHGLKLAVVSSSRNAPAVLLAAGLAEYFPIVVDGVVGAAQNLPGKPSPATYSYAAQLLNVPSNECIVVEDAVSGVLAGRAGSFHSVIGVDRGAGRQTLLDAGATLVVEDLNELL